MIELSGLTVRDDQSPHGDIAIEITGLRPGKKLYEELLIGDHSETTCHARIIRAREEFISWVELEGMLEALAIALNARDVGLIRQLLLSLVRGYTPSDDIVDWGYLEQMAEANALRSSGE